MSRDGSRSEGRYHHGNLRDALVDAALRLIAEHGPAGFTFAQAAREAGVSAAAPYRHFRDQQALLEEVARRGFDRFTRDLTAAWQDGRPDPFAAFQRCGRAYLAFARRDPAAYATMFGPHAVRDAAPGAPATPSDGESVRAASDRAFAVLRQAADTVVAAMPGGRRPPGLMVALHVWSVCHGIASLFIGNGTARRALPMPPEDLLEAAMLVYLDGLRG